MQASDEPGMQNAGVQADPTLFELVNKLKINKTATPVAVPKPEFPFYAEVSPKTRMSRDPTDQVLSYASEQDVYNAGLHQMP